MNIEYNPAEFSVIKEEDYGGSVGKFRMIRYDTGYYALQRYNINDFDMDNDSAFAWETMVITPHIDDPLSQDRVWNLCQGKLTIESLLVVLEDSSKLHNNELMELHLNLNPNMNDEVSDEIVKLIKTSEGDAIYESIIESIRLQDEYVKEYYENQSQSNNIRLLLLILLIIIAFGLIIMFKI